MADVRQTRREGVNRVERGPRSGPALQRVRAALPAIQAAAVKYKEATFRVTGGTFVDRTTRVERRVGPDPNLTPAGAQAKLNAARDEFQTTVNAALTAAVAAVNTVAAEHEATPELGTTLLLPPSRASELGAIAELLRHGTFQQWRDMVRRALTANDAPLAEVVSFVGRSQADVWHRDRAELDADRAALAAAFATPATTAGTYAQALVTWMREALENVAATLGREDGADQVLTAVQPALQSEAPADPAEWAVRWQEVVTAGAGAAVRRAKRRGESVESGVMELHGDTPATARLVPRRPASEAAGPVRTAGDAGPSAI